jgi:acyl-CoA synthetase (NDP forming)
MSLKPQSAAVLELLREQGEAGVTPALALSEVGTMRLAARIAELRAEGYEIVNLGWRTPNGRHVALYVLRETPMQRELWTVAS